MLARIIAVVLLFAGVAHAGDRSRVERSLRHAYKKHEEGKPGPFGI